MPKFKRYQGEDPAVAEARIAENIEARLLEYYNCTGKEIQLILDKNSFKFNISRNS